MKKFTLLAVIAFLFSVPRVFAQSSYTTSAGLGIDVGDGSTLVGPTFKHFFNKQDAIQADLLFSDHFAWLGAYYQYHGPVKEAQGLKWYLGLGPQLAFEGEHDHHDRHDTYVFLRPMAGLDYSLPSAPISMSFDWRPMLRLNHGRDGEPARFGLAFRYNFK